MANLLLPFVATWVFTLAGGLIVLGALGSLTNDSGSPLFSPYRLAWTGWSLEVVALLVALYALAIGPFRNWRATILFFYATVSGFLIPLTNDIFVAKGKLPGSNGSDARANAAGAGLIIVFIGNYVQAILTALHDTDEPKSQPAHDGNGKDLA